MAVAPFAVTEDPIVAGYTRTFNTYIAAFIDLFLLHFLNPFSSRSKCRV
jgi:hypothetical protein